MSHSQPHVPARSVAHIIIKPRPVGLVREPASQLPKAMAPAVAGMDEELVVRLKGLLASCGSGTSKHDRAIVLIIACIGEGVQTGKTIIDLATQLGFNGRHVGIMLASEAGSDPVRHRWFKNETGHYVTHP